MRTTGFLLGLCLALAAVACGGAARNVPPPAPPATPEALVSQVKGVVEQWRQGYEVRSLDALAPLYEQTDELAWAFQGRLLRGWPVVRDAIGTFFTAHAQVKVLVADLRVVGLGDRGAVATAQVSRRYGDGVTTVEEVGGLFLVLRHGDAGWRIVAEHFSYAPVAP